MFRSYFRDLQLSIFWWILLMCFLILFMWVSFTRNLWDFLRTTAQAFTCPWLVLGDFNVVVVAHEKTVCPPNNTSYIYSRNMIIDCQLQDLRLVVPFSLGLTVGELEVTWINVLIDAYIFGLVSLVTPFLAFTWTIIHVFASSLFLNRHKSFGF